MDLKGIRLAELVEAKIGYGQIAALKVAVDGTTNKARGFAHMEFYDAAATQRALGLLRVSLKCI